MALLAQLRYDRISAGGLARGPTLKELIQLADIDFITSPVKCISYAPYRELPRRVVGVCTSAHTVAGELILISAVQSRAGQTELELARSA